MFFLVVAVEFGAGLVEELTAHVTACGAQRNAAQATAQWQFTLEKARVKLGRHYQKNRVPNSPD